MAPGDPLATRKLLEGVSELTGIGFTAETIPQLLAELGSVEKFVAPTLQNTSNPSFLEAGYKHNVIPGTATAYVDCRTLPGQHEDVMLKIKELAGEGIDITAEDEGDALESPFDTPLVAQMQKSLLTDDPSAQVLPYTLSGGTDNKSMAELGITGYGFARSSSPATSTSRPCSTASTSECRSRLSSSGRGFSATS